MTKISNIVILGGGTAGWMAAALLKKVLAETVNITLVESEQIGSVGVGEATIPPIQHFNRVLGIDEAEFLRETGATMKLGIAFEGWKTQSDWYLHSFGATGFSHAFCSFQHFWLRARKAGFGEDLWHYDMNYLAATQQRFAKLSLNDPMLELPYAYHLDAGKYALFLRRFSEALGVTRVEGRVAEVQAEHNADRVDALVLENGERVTGDLFLDCSGFRALLIQQTLGAGFEDWSHWLPCDRALAVPSERCEQTLPYTRAIAREAGWQWRIPLQHRNGNGLVYASRFLGDDEATDILMQHLDTPALAEPKLIRFQTGRRRAAWKGNVIAVGLASGFIEPMESTSIHLIQSALVRLLHFFPHEGLQSSSIEEYNRLSQREYEQVRDFIILHYHVNAREGEPFWDALRHMPIPDTLQRKIALFRQGGRIFREQDELFLDSSWLQVMIGQGIEPEDYHALANVMPLPRLKQFMQDVHDRRQALVTDMPLHDAFLAMYQGQSGT